MVDDELADGERDEADADLPPAEAESEGEPEGDPEDWPPEHQARVLLRRLHSAIAAHIAAGELVPSLELELAMAEAGAELNWF